MRGLWNSKKWNSKNVAVFVLAGCMASGLALSSVKTFADDSHASTRNFFSNSTNLIADVAEAISPSVVNIDTQSTRQVAYMPFNSDIFQRFFGMQPMMVQPQQQVLRGTGSGVIFTADGDILTNNHVINGATNITVTLQDGRKYKAHVVGRDVFTDIAMIKIDDAPHLKPAKLGTSKNLRPGEWVIAVGSPLGFDHTVTLGIVSALSRQVPDINTNVSFIQTDAAINPGNSGGPLVNLDGEVIGINTAIAGSGQNIGFAIPVDTVKQIATELAHSGHVSRPWIGVSMTSLNPDLAKSLGLPETTQGVVVAQVLPNGPAAKAGLQQGDIIQRVNGTNMTDPKTLQDWVHTKPINTAMNIQILRDGQMQALTMHTELLPANGIPGLHASPMQQPVPQPIPEQPEQPQPQPEQPEE